MSGKIKDYSALVDRYEARIAANPSRESVLQAKLDSKIAAQIAKGNTVKIDGATVTSYDLVSSSGGGSSGGGSSSGGTTGSTYVLTSGTNLFTGTANNDTFTSDLVNEGGVANVTTLNNNDSLDGGNGTDTLIATYDDNATPLAIRNIETLIFSDSDGNTLDLVNASGFTQLTVTGSGGAVDINNIASIPTVTIQNQAQNVDLDFTAAAVAGAADAVTVNLSAVTAGSLTLDTGIESLTINSTGSVSNVLTGITATGVTSITVTGSAAVNLGTTLGTGVTSVNGAAATGAITVLQTGAQVSSIVGGAGNDVIDLSGNFVDGTTAASRDTVTGGAGTDTLVLTAAEAAAVGTAAEFSTVTGIETVRLDTDADSNNISMVVLGISTIEFASNVGAHTLTAVSGGEAQFDAADNATDARTYTIAGVGTTDSFTFDINGVDIGDGAQTLNGIETATFAVSGTSVLDGTITMTATAATETMIITGTSGTFTTGNITADVVNAGGYAGAFTTGTLQQSTVYTGASGIDTLTDSSAADIISLGAGADLLTLGDGDDVITLGDGIDTLDYGNIEGGGGATRVATTTGDTITDFATGAAGDVLDVDDLAAAGGYIETSTAITDLTAATEYEVVVLGHVGYASVGAAEDAIAGQSTAATDVVFVYFDTTLGYARLVFDADIGADGNLTAVDVMANFTNITSLAGVQAFVAANFDIA